jgi:eukaryotic-like serine/threonine-protein kinase
MPETMQIGQPNDENAGGGDGSLTPNTILLRRYKILGVLGGGGMGTVYKARDLNFPKVQKYAAVKEMHNPSNDRVVREQTLATFQREANILATLSHHAIPKIYDFFDQNERAYLVMEHINGRDLEAILTQTRTLPIDKVIEWSLDMCDVLHYLHSHQPDPIVFRDIKPSNIMVDSLGKVRLIDFGIAKTFVQADRKKHTIIGTEGYSAPEQYKGQISPLSDQYSLGATLHHILTRKDPRLEHPFTFQERPISEFNPEVPSWFKDVIERALQFAPDDRFQNCEEMANAIRSGMQRGVNVSMGVAGGVSATSEPGTAATMAITKGIGNEIEPKWVFKTEDEIRTTPFVHDGRVFIGSYDTNMWSLKLDDGDLLWKYATQGGIASSPVVNSNAGLVLFGSEDFTFNALNYRTGKMQWSYTTKDRIRSSPSLSMDFVFFGSDDGYLYALLSANGQMRWSYDGGAAIRTTPTVAEDIIIFGNDLGEVQAVTLAGERKWTYRGKRGIESSPVIDASEGICYVGAMDGSLFALDATSGYNTWRFRSGGAVISTPALYDKLLIFGSVDGNLYALDAYNGREKWRFTTEDPILSSPIVHGDKVFVGGMDSNLYCINAKNGKEIWKFKAQDAIVSTPCIEEETIIFGSIDYNVYALPLLD